MSRVALQNVSITDKLDGKLAYIPCYNQCGLLVQNLNSGKN